MQKRSSIRHGCGKGENTFLLLFAMFLAMQNALQDLRRRMRRVNHSANILWKEMTQPYHEKKQLVPEPGELEYRESEAPYRAPKRAPRKVDKAAINGQISVLS